MALSLRGPMHSVASLAYARWAHSQASGRVSRGSISSSMLNWMSDRIGDRSSSKRACSCTECRRNQWGCVDVDVNPAHITGSSNMCGRTSALRAAGSAACSSLLLNAASIPPSSGSEPQSPDGQATLWSRRWQTRDKLHMSQRTVATTIAHTNYAPVVGIAAVDHGGAGDTKCATDNHSVPGRCIAIPWAALRNV